MTPEERYERFIEWLLVVESRGDIDEYMFDILSANVYQIFVLDK